MIDCCIIDDYDPPRVYLQRVVRARKQHKCCECGKAIEPGRMYEIVSGLWDGRWDTFKTCARCANVRDEFFRRGYMHERLVDDFHECYGFDYRDGVPPDFAPCGPRKTEIVNE